MATTACQFPDPVTLGTCDRGSSNQHVTLYINGLVYHGFLCTQHRKVLGEMAPEYGLVPVGARTKDAKRRALYLGASGEPFNAAQAREWLIEQGEDQLAGAGRLSNEVLEKYAATH